MAGKSGWMWHSLGEMVEGEGSVPPEGGEGGLPEEEEEEVSSGCAGGSLSLAVSKGTVSPLCSSCGMLHN